MQYDLVMTNMELVVKALDNGHWEMGEGFKGLSDGDVWRRAHPRLLSVGELAAHVAYAHATYLGEGKLESPLLAGDVRYYTTMVESPLVLELGATEVYREAVRLWEEGKALLLENQPDWDETHPVRRDMTWGQLLDYMVFHVAYHTGQIYSVRHLMGHETEDN